MFKKTLTVRFTPWENVCNVFLLMDTAHSAPGSVDYSGTEEGEMWPTVWTSVLDVDHMTWYLKLANYPNTIWVNLSKIDFATLTKIGTLDPRSFKLYGQVNNKFRWTVPTGN